MTIVPKQGDGDFSGCSRSLSQGDRLIFTLNRRYKQKFTAVVNMPVGPEWLFQKGISSTNIQDPEAITFFDLGDQWDPRGVCNSSVESDAILEGTETICISQTIIRGPYRGGVESFTRDGDVITPYHISGCCYDVEFEFEHPLLSEQATVPLNQSDPDPLHWNPVISVVSEEETQVVENGIFLGIHQSPPDLEEGEDPPEDNPIRGCEPCYTGDPPELEALIQYLYVPPTGSLVPITIRAIGSCGPIVNSAFETLVPAPERLRSIKTIRITKYREHYDPTAYDCFENCINDDEVILAYPSRGFSLTAPKHTLRLNRVEAIPQTRVFRSNTGTMEIVVQEYYEITYDITYDKQTFEQDYLNEGMTQVSTKSGTIDTDQLGTTRLAREALTHRDTDGTIVKVESPVPLDQFGQVLEGHRNPFYLRYLKDPVADFSDPMLDLTTPT